MEAVHQEDEVVVNLPHHIQQELCTTRATYRQGKKLTAVKVYTVNNESQHLLIYRVPEIDLRNELHALCERYGKFMTLQKLELVDPGEEFTEIFHVCYSKIRDARKAKRFLDGRSFYGSLLHVCYAPELETFEETRHKLINRRNEIAYFTGRRLKVSTINTNTTSKRKSSGLRNLHGNKLLKSDPQRMDSIIYGTNCSVPEYTITPSTYDPLSKRALQPVDPSMPGSSGGTFVMGPYDQMPSYPSQEILKLPGQEIKSMRDQKLMPSSVIKKNPSTVVSTNKIIFHKKNAS